MNIDGKPKLEETPDISLKIEVKNELGIVDDLTEWSKLITELSEKEIELLTLKDTIFEKEQWIIEHTDFKSVYGKNNVDVRKLHLKNHMVKEYTQRRDLELSIDYLKRRVSFLKQLVYTKTVLIEVKE